MDPENLDDWLHWLEKMVLDQDKVITSRYMLIHTGLNSMQIQCLLDKFVAANETLHAFYYLMVKMGSGKDAPRQCLMVKREDLEQTKIRFDGQITICNVHSVHKHAIEEDELFNIDWNDGNASAPREYAGKTFIKCAKAEKSYEAWKESETERSADIKKPPTAVTKQPRQPSIIKKAESPHMTNKAQGIGKEKPKAGPIKEERRMKASEKQSDTHPTIPNYFETSQTKQHQMEEKKPPFAETNQIQKQQAVIEKEEANRLYGQTSACNAYSVHKHKPKEEKMSTIVWNVQNPGDAEELVGKTSINSTTTEKFHENQKKLSSQNEHQDEKKKLSIVETINTVETIQTEYQSKDKIPTDVEIKQPHQPVATEKNETPHMPSTGSVRRSTAKPIAIVGPTKRGQKKKTLAVPRSQPRITSFFMPE